MFTTWISKGRYPRPTGWEPAGAALALVSVFLPRKTRGRYLGVRCHTRIVTKIGGDRETGCISKDQPGFAVQIIILEDIPDSVFSSDLG